MASGASARGAAVRRLRRDQAWPRCRGFIRAAYLKLARTPPCHVLACGRSRSPVPVACRLEVASHRHVRSDWACLAYWHFAARYSARSRCRCA
eukprot:scaffold4372_cov397-Prasinococcus_capsulatus_cf.AAC.17